MSALIIGHSFVRRMSEFRRSHPLDLRRQFPYIFMEGKGGQTVKGLWSEADLIRTTEPRVVVLDIGSNDLCDPIMSPVDLALNIIELAGTLLATTPGLQSVVIMQILPRGSRWRPRRGQRSLAEFNTAVFHTNTYLSDQCYQNTLPGLKFYKLRKMSVDVDAFLGRDGVHLNFVGQSKYRRNYRGALLQGINNVHLS